MNKRSETLFNDAKEHLVGGVNSPVRAYPDYKFAPPFIAKALGSRLWDVDGNEYIDYVGSWGPMILGHVHPEVVAAIKKAAEKGTSYGAPTEGETALAKLVKGAFPSIDLVRFVSSGTEATMSAIRLARGYTGRNKIIKFNGCYHGHSDYLLVKAGSGAASFGTPDSKGVPEDFARHTLVAEYNDLESVNGLIRRFADDVAAIIVEPIAGNMGCVPPTEGFLKSLRALCDKNGILLIFDEVITGFRVAYGGAQELYDVTPDLTCLGKILSGGLPMGAYGGHKEIMEMLSPLGPVYQAGTLSGNPLAVAAGIATLKLLSPSLEGMGITKSPPSFDSAQDRPNLPPQGGGIYSRLDSLTSMLTSGISTALTKQDIPHTINRVGSMFSVFFTGDQVRSYKDAAKADRTLFDKYFIHMLQNGIYLAPSPFESAFVSFAHTKKDIEVTLKVLNELNNLMSITSSYLIDKIVNP